MKEKSLYGSHCENDISGYNINVALLAVNAISSEKGITDFRFNEIGIIKAMISSSEKKYILADSSKFEAVSCVNVCPLEIADGFLTDKFLKQEVKENYEKKGYTIYVS